MEQLDLQDRLEVPEHLGPREVVANLDHRELVGHLVVQVQRVRLASLEVLARLDLLDR